MKINSLKKSCTFLAVSFSLTACVGGVYDEDVIESRDQEISIFGVTGEPNQKVDIYCQADQEAQLIRRIFSHTRPLTNAEGHKGYPYSEKLVLPKECWKVGNDLADEPAPGETRRFLADINVMVDGRVAKTMTKDTYDNCILPNTASLAKMSECDFEENIDLKAERVLPFRLAQLAKSVYLDGVTSSPDEQKENRKNWLSANGYIELGYWFGSDRYPYTVFSSMWEVSLAKSEDGKQAIVAFAGSEPPEMQTVNGKEVINWGDISDWRFDTWVDLKSAAESEYANSNGRMEALCEQYQCKIHAGFLTYSSNFWQYAFDEDALIEQLKLLKAQGVEEVHFTGHSLGGAMATVTAAYYESQREYDSELPAISSIVTYGAPWVGDSQFKLLYQHLGLASKTTNYTTPGDPGPRFPRDLHLCDALDGVVFQTACWSFAVGGINAGNRWRAVKDEYASVGSEIVLRRENDQVVMTEGSYQPWNDIDIDTHLMSNYIDLLSDCEAGDDCWIQK